MTTTQRLHPYFLDQTQSNLRELKNENHFLKDYIHRLNAESSAYQATHPPKALKKEMNVSSFEYGQIENRLSRLRGIDYERKVNSFERFAKERNESVNEYCGHHSLFFHRLHH
jgi:hypothetical protein